MRTSGEVDVPDAPFEGDEGALLPGNFLHLLVLLPAPAPHKGVARRLAAPRVPHCGKGEEGPPGLWPAGALVRSPQLAQPCAPHPAQAQETLRRE